HTPLGELNHCHTQLNRSSHRVREVLNNSPSSNVHPNNFPVGKAVGTVFAKSQLVIRRTGDETWELLIRRSFSDYWWLWLQDAAEEYGLSIQD
ncbi:sarcosine oxidase subunit gamma family protein, partial [Pseudomonas akapageensis]|uniref:sarcosine oxidase subunit gamma family protein n=1 Tax=Pseudomonas akapageensis TaxID=2609961 RepID=UPI001C49A832